MRKFNAMVATAAVGALVLSGCAGSSEPAAASGPVQLTMWTGFTGGDRAAYEALVTQFNASHPDVQVSMEVQPWDTIAQKLPSAWATGQGPDIATPNFDPNVLANYVETNSLLVLDAVGEGDSKINADQLAPAAIKAFTTQDKLYAVPANIATLQLYYNKTLFAAAGIDGPPATVDEMRNDAAKLKGDGVFGLSVADHETIQMWPVLQWLDGADIVDDKGCAVLDSAADIKSLTAWAALVQDKAAPVGLTGAESDALFSAGKAAMQLNGPWAAAGYTEAGVDFGVAPVPTGVDGKVTLASTVPFAVSAKTKHPAESQQFLAWWTGKDAQRSFALASGFPPVRTDMGSDKALAANTVVAGFAAALPDARLYLPGVTGASKVDTEAYIPMIGAITRGSDVAAEVQTASGKINSITGCTGS